MAGYIDFQNGNALDEAQLDGFLMRQSLMRFANATDRDNTLAAVVEDGMVTYTSGDDQFWARRGGAWREQHKTIRKTADENVVNSAAMQSDDQLLFPGVANGRYLVEVGLIVTVSGSSSASDFKLGWSLPSGSFTGGSAGPEVAMAAASAIGQGNWQALIGAGAATLTYGLFSTGATFILHKAVISLGGTAGTVAFQWAQNTATAVTTTVNQSSWLSYERLPG